MVSCRIVFCSDEPLWFVDWLCCDYFRLFVGGCRVSWISRGLLTDSAVFWGFFVARCWTHRFKETLWCLMDSVELWRLIVVPCRILLCLDDYLWFLSVFCCCLMFLGGLLMDSVVHSWCHVVSCRNLFPCDESLSLTDGFCRVLIILWGSNRVLLCLDGCVVVCW